MTVLEGMEIVLHISEYPDQITIAFSFYKIGKFFAKLVMRKRHEISNIEKITLKEVNVAVTYFEEASRIMIKTRSFRQSCMRISRRCSTHRTYAKNANFI